MPDPASALQANLPLVALVLGLLALNLLWSLWLTSRTRQLEDRVSGGARGDGEGSLDSVLDAHIQRVYDVARDVQAVDARATSLEARGRKAIQRVGFVRFNPFEDTGSNQSFALALLDDDEDGLVLSSLHSRQATRIYAKPINGGIGDAPLSREEAEAVRLARNARPSRARG